MTTNTSSTKGPVVVATDLTADSNAALIRGRGHADALGVPLIVCHVVPDVMRHHPLSPQRDENDLVLSANLTKRAAELVTDQVGRVLRMSVDDYRTIIETGSPDEEIVRIAEEQDASLIAIGAKPREGAQRVLGHVAERVVRYAHTSVLIARDGGANRKVILVPTDFGEGSRPALSLASELVRVLKVEGTLLHVMQLPSTVMPSVMVPLGGVWIPPSKSALEALDALGKSTLAGLAKEHGFTNTEQIDGEPGRVIVERAEALGAEMIIMGSRGRKGLARLVLGSVAEWVIRHSTCSVLVAR